MDTPEGSIRSYFRRSLRRAIRFFYVGLIEPRLEKEDLRRREFILNVILLTSVLMSGILTLIVVVQFYFERDEYNGASPELPFIVFLIFSFLHVLSRSRLFAISAYLLILIYFLATTMTIYHWGSDTPQALISFALIIVISSILIGSQFSFFVSFIIFCTLLLVNYLHVDGIVVPELDWKNESLTMVDVFEFSITLTVIAIVSWLSNREIKRSLKRARLSEVALKKERDMLEERVKRRTEELQRIQYEKTRQLFRMAEFGRLSSGLFHDLSNYINALLLNVKKVDPSGKGMFAEAKDDLERVEITMDKVADFISVINRQISQENSLRVFSVSGEISTIIKAMSYVANKNDIEIKSNFREEDVYMFGDVVKFNQIITNIIVNAIDAYELVDDDREKRIHISIKKEAGFVVIYVRDWACGVPDALRDKIFEPFFTTKKGDRGMGVGLSNVKELVEGVFDGSISFESEKGAGTLFVIKLKIENEIVVK